jgi:hypothetical protein
MQVSYSENLIFDNFRSSECVIVRLSEFGDEEHGLSLSIVEWQEIFSFQKLMTDYCPKVYATQQMVFWSRAHKD